MGMHDAISTRDYCYWVVSLLLSNDAILCQVWENNRGNSRNSGHQVQTYKMLEGTLASAYVLHPFQTLVPRFQNEKMEYWRLEDWRIGVEDQSCSQSRTLENKNQEELI